MAKRRITTKAKAIGKEEKLERLASQFTEWRGDEITTRHAWLSFKVAQEEKGNSKATLAFYDRFYKKLAAHYAEMWGADADKTTPINWLEQDGAQLWFIKSLGDVNQQTINSYLRGYRAFGNYCYDKGFINSFNCPIKEVEPPAKEVYTKSELQRLLVKPSIENFEQYRNYIIISLILSTGARSNTILNLQIKDVDTEEGYITFNTTKAHKVVRVGLERKMRRELVEYIRRWRSSRYIDDDLEEDVPVTDYLFCNNYGEQMSRGGLTKAIKVYNNSRGVEKTSIHLFRHTFAKNWITSGGDIISLAKVLTHTELDMVKRYSNLYGEDVKAEIEQHSTLAQIRTRSGKTLK